MPSYTARVIANIDNGKGCWQSQKIGVFRKEGESEDQISEYVRNYSSFMNTFYHFKSGGKDLALFSSDYTCTRIMELPSCKDIGGEKPDSFGFCPTGLYVPAYIECEFELNGERHRYRVYEPSEDGMNKALKDEKIVSDGLVFCPFGFVSGCIWGDDTSWKIQFLDLSKAHEGTLVRDDRFGYIELPHKMKLKDVIGMDSYDENFPSIRIATESSYDLKTGKCHKFDE